MKLITQGTIEDKIFELQQKKKEMIDSVIQPGETFLSKCPKVKFWSFLSCKSLTTIYPFLHISLNLSKGHWQSTCQLSNVHTILQVYFVVLDYIWHCTKIYF